MDHVQRKGEVLIVSLALGAAGSGVYSKAQVLSRAPVKVLSGVLAPVLFPAMSGVKTDIGHLKSLYLKALQSMALVSVPLGLLIGIFSEPIILFLLGLQWAETAHLAPIFGFLLLWTPITKCSSVVLKATGHIKPLVYGYACFTVVTIIGCSYAVVYGLVGIALSVLTTTFLLAIGLSILACRAIGVSGREFLGSLAVVYACGFVMGVVGLSCNFFLSESIIGPHLMGSVIGSLLSSVAYLICLSVRTVDAVHVLAELFGLSNRFGVGNGRNV